jgi:hypothetical protein
MSTKPNIFQALQNVKNSRRKEGTRHHIAVVLLVNIMAIMSGYTGIDLNKILLIEMKKSYVRYSILFYLNMDFLQKTL